jgi:hypothetical protein
VPVAPRNCRRMPDIKTRLPRQSDPYQSPASKDSYGFSFGAAARSWPMGLPFRIFVAAGVLSLGGCAGTPAERSAPRASAESAGPCIPVRELSQWEPYDDSSIALSMPGSSQAYLLRLARPIEGLEDAGDIDIVDTNLDGLICPAAGDEVLVADCDCASAEIASIQPFDLRPTAHEL